jgi:hypothetical protein
VLTCHTIHTSARETSQAPVAVGLFDTTARAQQALDALRRLGLADAQLGLVGPNQLTPASGDARPMLAGVADGGLLGAAAAGGDLAGVLVDLGIGDGEARYYAREVQAGRTLVVADGSASAQARDVLRQHGARDARAEGRDLVRGGESADGTPGRPAPQAADVTDRWEDVRSRYETLFAQHFGTTDLSWQQAEPLYRYAWQAANAPARRGRPWSEVEAGVRRDWEAQAGRLSWSEAAGPIRDVWEDVAAEASTAEGGAERRVRRPGSDQSGPASSVTAPPGPA